jgi:DNA-binding protein HU-beta
MNKVDFVSAVADKTGLNKKTSSEAIDAVLETITEVLVARDSISFIGFGAFSTAPRAARTARVPGTDKVVDVPATTAVKFKVGKQLKDAVAKS